MSPKPKVNFYFLKTLPSLRERSKLKSFLLNIFKKENRTLESISLIFTTDRNIHEMNKTFLNHDYLTDILTFDLSEAEGAIMAEIYISVERVKENAFFHHTSFKNEIHRVIFHGILHLCGYKDKTEEEKAKMRDKENEYLSLYFR